MRNLTRIARKFSWFLLGDDKLTSNKYKGSGVWPGEDLLSPQVEFLRALHTLADKRFFAGALPSDRPRMKRNDPTALRKHRRCIEPRRNNDDTPK